MAGNKHGNHAAEPVRDVIRNIIFFGVGLVVLLFLGDKWPTIGRIGFWVYAVMTVIDVGRVVVMWATAILLVFAPDHPMTPIRWASNVGQTIEMVFTAMYAYVLYARFLAPLASAT